MNKAIMLLKSQATTIEDLTALMMPHDTKETIALEHFIGDNLLVRQAHYPKGSLIVGRVHKTNHVFMLVKGKMSVWVEGQGRKVLTAPCIFESKAGVQRVGYAHADSTCLNMHGFNDGEELTAENSEEILTSPDKASYATFLKTISRDLGDALVLGKHAAVLAAAADSASSQLALEKIESD